jgi:hypothetical protein
MPRCGCRHIVAKIIQEQERIEISGVAEAKRAAQVHAGAFARGLGLNQPLHGSQGHGHSSVKQNLTLEPRWRWQK